MEEYPPINYHVGAWGEQWIRACKTNVSHTSNRHKYWAYKMIPSMYAFRCRLVYEGIEMRDEGEHFVLCCVDELERVC
jgi:hypothetical protein